MKKNNQYDKLFPTDKEKAEAFDQIAEHFYNLNFGTLSKSDMEVLMFSIYIDQIYNQGRMNFEDYSDYTLSKNLGITQTRISNLKVKKELQYPDPAFDWKQIFIKISENAVYEDGKIKLQIPDKNVFSEIKHVIDQKGGFLDIQRNQTLLQVRPAYFLDLMILVSDSQDKERLHKEIIAKIKQNHSGIEIMEQQTIGQVLKNESIDMIISLIESICPVFNKSIETILKHIVRQMQNKI